MKTNSTTHTQSRLAKKERAQLSASDFTSQGLSGHMVNQQRTLADRKSLAAEGRHAEALRKPYLRCGIVMVGNTPVIQVMLCEKEAANG